MTAPAAQPPKSLLGRPRILAPTAGVHVSPICLGAMSFGDAWKSFMGEWIIGPGLLVGSGRALQNGGPASVLIGFGVIGIIAFSIMQSLGELTTLYPGRGSFVSLADRFVDKGLSVAVGWNYFIIWAAVLANEYNVISSIMVFLSGKVPLWGYFLIFWSVFLGLQLLGVEAFGEAEFWLALMKLLGLTAYFIFAIIYASGALVGQQDALGFRYWHTPGPWNGNGFQSVAALFAFCTTFYADVESVAVAATETKNPGRAVPQVIRQVFWRIIFVYVGSAYFIGLICPANARNDLLLRQYQPAGAPGIFQRSF